MQRVLCAWLGNTDIQAASGNTDAQPGPVGGALAEAGFDRLLLFNNYKKSEFPKYAAWLKQNTANAPALEHHHAQLSSPTNFGEIYQAATKAIDRLLREGDRVALTFHLSPGTSAMAAVWILLSQSKYRGATLIETHKQTGLREVDIPFHIAAEFLPELHRPVEEQLVDLAKGTVPKSPEFSAIMHRSASMERVIARARVAATVNVPVLILGESGTGKELLASAIHHSSDRKNGPFKPVNCGAIPAELVDSELFGYKKGAFTGATRDKAGLFEAANGGTLFLDEIGELPLAAQVKLLRVIQEEEIVPVGGTQAKKINVRIVAATHRDLISAISDGSFREDLFHRVAVAVLQVPALRERQGDIGLLVDYFIERARAQLPALDKKKLSPGARNLLLQHSWPGNVRELENTLIRACMWSTAARVSEADMRESILPLPRRAERAFDRALGDGFDIKKLLGDVAAHYLRRALQEAQGSKTRAAELLGLPSYQTLSNWLLKYGVEK